MAEYTEEYGALLIEKTLLEKMIAFQEKSIEEGDTSQVYGVDLEDMRTRLDEVNDLMYELSNSDGQEGTQ